MQCLHLSNLMLLRYHKNRLQAVTASSWLCLGAGAALEAEGLGQLQQWADVFRICQVGRLLIIKPADLQDKIPQPPV